MDRTTQSNYSGGMHPSRPSPLSYSFQQEELSYPDEKYGASEKQIKNRSCLPGYPNQRSSTSNATNTSRRAQQVRSASTVRSNHRDVVDTLRTDEIFMMDHLAIIPPSTSMPNPTNMNVHDDKRDLYRNHRDRNHSNSHLRSTSSSRGTSQNRRSRQVSSSISRSATAALATPRSSSSSTSRGRSSSTYHHQNNHPNASQQYSNSTASTGSRYNNYPNAATATSASPSKRSSSRISFSSQLSVTTTAPSIHDIDDNGTVSTRRSENSTNHRHYHRHKHPSPIADMHTATMGKAKPNGKKLSSNQSADSATTKSSSGTNAMGNTKAMTQRRNTQSSAISPDPKLASEISSTINPSQVTLDVDTMKTHVQATRRVIDDLHRLYGASNERRRFVLTNACNLFDHTFEQLHNIEVSNGALSVVSKHFFLHVQQQLPHTRKSAGDEILYLILSATEMLSRCAPSSFINAFYKITPPHPTSTNESTSNSDGVVYFVTCMLRVLSGLETNMISNDSSIDKTRPDVANNDAHDDDRVILLNDECIHCIGRILISMSRSSEFRSILYQQPDLVKGLTRMSSTKANEVSTIKTNPECRLCRLHVFANLAKNSNNERREFLYELDGFLDSLLRYGNFDPICSIRQAAAWCILELTNSSNNCSAMAQNNKVLGTLVKMILVDDITTATSLPSATVASTRESALTALQNISFDRSNRLHVIQFKSGIVLEALKKTLTTDVDAKARRRAAGTVVNLVCEDTAEFMVSYQGLSDTLALVATQDNNTDVQTRAALSLTKLAVHVSDMQNHPTELSSTYLTILDALVVTSLSKLHSTRVTSAIRSLVRNHPDHRPILARHDGIVDTLIDVIQSSLLVVDENLTDDDGVDYNTTNEPKNASKITDRTNAMHAIAHLANSDDATRKHLCSRPTLLIAMVEATQAPDSQDLAIVVLERLATVPSNRYTLSHCIGLIVAVAEAVERESRHEKQQTYRVTTGQPQMLENRCDDDEKCSDDGKSVQQGPSCYLAKALLMSLLVAL